MTAEEALQKLDNLRRHCETRGIPFSLTLKDWVEAWGDKIEQRGELQLQRKVKEHGFIAGNIKIGERPKKNAHSMAV